MSKHLATDGALRAAMQIERDPCLVAPTAELIDRETGLPDVLDILGQIISEAGDLIETRSPELVALARAAMRRSGDHALRQAE